LGAISIRGKKNFILKIIISIMRKIFRMTLLLTVVLLITSCNEETKSSAVSEQKDQPNIIWISFEDISPYFSFYGDSTASTPNIDKLASESVIYSQVYSAAGVCAPSRSAIITGMYPTYMGTSHMRTGKDIMSWGRKKYKKEYGVKDTKGVNIPEYSAVIQPEIKCFPEFLRAKGYYCTNNEKTDYQFAAPFTAWDENDTKAHWKHTPKGEPFFAVFNLNVTHESKLWKHKHLPLTVNPKDVKVPPFYPDNDSVRLDIARQYSNIEMLDKQVAKLLQELKDAGQYDNSYIFFFSDHGGAMPRGKREAISSGLHVPFLVKYPKGMNKTGRDDKLISFIDLAPSVLELAGIKSPDYMQGISMFSGKREYIFAARDRMDEFTTKRRSVCDGRYLYVKHLIPNEVNYQNIQYRMQLTSMRNIYKLHNEGKLNKTQELWFTPLDGDEELYDLQNDPFEVNNLANNEDMNNVLERFRGVYAKWRENISDKCQYPESEMLEQMWPGGVQPTTANVEQQEKDGKIILSCATEGASIGYRVNGGKWQLYTKPLDILEGSKLEFKAIRIGFKESEITSI
jgi:arylsulfatase A-like enzyme